MRKRLLYLALQGKRGLKSLPRVALFALLLSLCALLLCTLLLQGHSQSEAQSLLRIGITGYTDHPYIQLGILAVQGFDSSSTYVEFETMREEEAQEALQNGTLSGYLRMPENFVDSVTSGKIPELVYVSVSSAVGIGPILTEEVLDAVSVMVASATAGILGVQDMAGDFDLTEDHDGLVEDINIHYVTYVLKRGELYEVTYLGLENGLSFGGFYLCGALFLLLLLLGIVMAPVAIRRTRALERVALCRGIGLSWQIAGDFLLLCLPPFLVVLLLFAVFGALPSSVTASLSASLPELALLDGSFLLHVLPLVLMVAALQLFLYECVSDLLSGLLLQSVVAVGLAYLSGCFYPVSFFPEALASLSAALPGGVALRYLSSAFGGTGGAWWALGGYTALFLLLTALVRLLRIRKEKA